MIVYELSDIDPDEVSPVRRGANRRRFALLKADDGSPISRELDDVLAVPLEDEGALNDLLHKAGVGESARLAAVVAARLLKGFEDELPPAFRIELGDVAKAAEETRSSEQALNAAADAAAAAAAGAQSAPPSSLHARLLERVEKMGGAS